MDELDTPARLAFWPNLDGEDGIDFATLREALAKAAEMREAVPWIVTLSGSLFLPAHIDAMIVALGG